MLEKDGISYYFLKRHHVTDLRPILEEAFLLEPISCMIGGNKPELTKISFYQQLVLWEEVTINNGLSVVAIDSTNNKVVGGFSSMDMEAMPGFCALIKTIGCAYDSYRLMPRVGEFIEVIN